MTRDDQLAVLLEDVHIPLHDPLAPGDWKEWYHFILFDPASRRRILANLSLSGVPGRGQIIATVFATLPAAGSASGELTFGFCADHEWLPGMVARAPTRAQGPGFQLLLDGRSSRLAARDERARVALDLRGKSLATSLYIPEFTPHGTGFVGWGLMPVVDARGELHVGEHVTEISPAWFCYHDHNYGRFRWGDDIGWIWGVASLGRGEDKLTVVLHRGNNRDHTKQGAPHLFVYVGSELRKMFVGNAVRLRWRWTAEAQRPPRMPGAMASLFSERTLRLPAGLLIEAQDDVDALSLNLAVTSTIELVLADDLHRQYTFIEELSGKAESVARLGARRHEGEGHFYAEFVY